MAKGTILDNQEAAELLAETGLLFEINRKVLHPLGLALAITVNKRGKVTGFAGMTDCCNDPEGVIFADDATGPEKLRKFMAGTGKAKLQARLKALGFVIQPFPGID